MKIRIRHIILICGFIIGSCLCGNSLKAQSLNHYRTRKEMGELLTRIVEREVDKAPVQVLRITSSRKRVTIYTSRAMAYYPFREDNCRAIRDSIRKMLPAKYRKADIYVIADHHRMEDLIPLAYRTKTIKRKKDIPIRFTNTASTPLITRLNSLSKPIRGLQNRHLALWQSHGRYFDQVQNRWRWQRSLLWETCEDLYTQGYVLPFLVPMLENAGAIVLLPRERDTQRAEMIADNSSLENYMETGRWEDGGEGFAHLKEVYRTGENPFLDGNTRKTLSSRTESSTAIWSAEIPQRGEYAVYVSYKTEKNSAEDALYTVHHMGGETQFSINQTMGGGTWIYLGHFLLEEGSQQVVTLSNISKSEGRIVSADAVKIGGGYGNIARTTCDSLRTQPIDYVDETSGYPRFCEGARYWLQWAGFPEKVYAPKNHKDDYKEDYMSRAWWVNDLMGGSERLPDSLGRNIPIDMALALHSDAGVRDGDETVGTLGIFYTKENKGHFEGGANRYRSRDLTDIVMTQVVKDIRRSYEPDWNRRGLWNRAYYEARIPSVPTMLLELLSHQNFADMRYGLDPKFRFTVSRAIYKGILRYLSSQYQTPYVVQPLPVQDFYSEIISDESVRLSWVPTIDSLESSAQPSAYIVYTRKGDGGFDNGQKVKGNHLTVNQKPGIIYSYKVTAINDGGESFPSEILSICQVPEAKGEVLIINGFTRVGAPESFRKDSLEGFRHTFDGGVPYRYDISFVGEQRIFERKMARCENDSIALGACSNIFETDVVGGNTFDYPYLHGVSIAKAGYSFRSSSVGAIQKGYTDLKKATIVDLILGKQRSTKVARGFRGVEYKTFTPELQRIIKQWRDKGISLFLSGCYIGYDLCESENATESDKDFAKEVLHIQSSGAICSSTTNRVRVNTPFKEFSRNEYTFHHEYGKEHYRIEAANVLKKQGDNSHAIMRFDTKPNQSAMVANTLNGGCIVMGFPFESLTDENQQNRLMNDILKFFETLQAR